jgi:hypothetical protein
VDQCKPLIVGTRNPITAEWAIGEQNIGKKLGSFVASVAGGGSMPLRCPPVLGARDDKGVWRQGLTLVQFLSST